MDTLYSMAVKLMNNPHTDEASHLSACKVALAESWGHSAVVAVRQDDRDRVRATYTKLVQSGHLYL